MALMKSHVRHEERDCDAHGRTLFGERIVGNGCSKRFICMKCDSKRSGKRLKEIREGTFEPQKTWTKQKPEKDYGFCNDHFLVKNALGECAGCED